MSIETYIFDNDSYFSQNLHLAIEVSEKKISLSIFDLDTNIFIGLETFAIDINKNFIENSKLLKNIKPKTVSCSYNTLNFTLIPFALFDEKELMSYANFNFDKKDNDILLYSKSIKKNIVTCFSINEKLYGYLLLNFPNIELKHISSFLIDSVSMGVHINFSGSNTFECLFINETGLLFYNGYKYASPEETLYYISLVCDKLNLNIKKIKFSLSGSLNKNTSDLWENYIPSDNLEYKTFTNSYSFSNKLLNLPKHKYYSLIKQYSCV